MFRSGSSEMAFPARIIRWGMIGCALILILRALAAQAQTTVPSYRVFEAQLTNTKNYTNPFQDVTLLEAI